MGFGGAEPEATGRPAYHPATLLKIYIYGYLNRIQSSRRLERETQRNVELIWLTGRLMPAFKTIADLRKDNGRAITRVGWTGVTDRSGCSLDGDERPRHRYRRIQRTNGGGCSAPFDRLSRGHERRPRPHAIVVHGQASSRCNRDAEALADRGYFKGKEILECSSAGIDVLVAKPQTSNNQAKGQFAKRDFSLPADDEYQCPAGQRAIWRFATVENGQALHKYWSSACPRCPIKARCTGGEYRRITRWEHEHVLEEMQTRLDRMPEASRVRRRTVEHPFGTLKAWMGDALPDLLDLKFRADQSIQGPSSAPATDPRTPRPSLPSVFTHPRHRNRTQ
jgi:hypothetical protein